VNQFGPIWPASGAREHHGQRVEAGRPDIWQVPTGLFRHADAWLNHPAWLRAGTSLGPGMLPLFVTLGDALRLVENIVDSGREVDVLAQLVQQPGTPTNPLSAGLLDQARNPAEGLCALFRYSDVTHPHLMFSCEASAAGTALTMRPNSPLSPAAFAFLAGILAIMVVRYLQRFAPHCADDLVIGLPGHATLLSEKLGVPITQQPGDMCSLVIAPALAARPNPGHDPQLWQIALDRLADLERAVRRPDLIMRLEAVIGERLSRDARLPTLAEAASALGVSDRTLSRRLADVGTGLREIADRVRERRARQMIAMRGVEIDDIACQLGYPDRASFSRHFRAWFGTSPAEYRRSLDG
jgi:AraC-like DNA-binding protein